MNGDFLGNLKVDAWYKVLIVLGGGLGISFFVELPPNGLDNGQLQSISTGVLLIGLGFWKCKRISLFYKPPNAYTSPAERITNPIYVFDLLGVIFILCGIFLIINAFLKFI